MAAANILILEDNLSLLKLFGRTLIKSGYTVDLVDTLKDAAAHLDSGQHYDVFVCDMRIGSENSADLLRARRATLAEKATEIIVISAEEHYRALCDELDIKTFLPKPVVPGTLIKAMTQLRLETEDKAVGGVTVEWANQEQRSLVVSVVEPWTWSQFYTALDRLNEMSDGVERPVGVVLDMRHSGSMPGNALPHVRNTLSHLPKNLSTLVVVGAASFVQKLFSIANDVSERQGGAPRLLFALTMLEAAARLEGA